MLCMTNFYVRHASFLRGTAVCQTTAAPDRTDCHPLMWGIAALGQVQEFGDKTREKVPRIGY